MPEAKLVASVLALVLLAGCAGSPSDVGAGPATVKPTIDTDASAFPNQSELNEIAAKVRHLGEGELTSIYAGVAIDVYGDRVNVWTKDPARFKAAIAGVPWGQRVRLHPARYAAIDLEPTFQRILREQDHWRRQGLPVVMSGVRHDGLCIEVGTPDPQRAEREFRRRYPGVAMCFSAHADTGNPWDERD